MHSSQGASVDKSITVFDSEKTKLITREWFYTALTRSTDINKVKFYRSYDEIDELNEDTMRRYLQRKVNKYKLQDLKAGRTIDETKYITAEWLIDRVNSRCNECSCNFKLDVYNGLTHSNFTANRLNNDIPHYIENCHVWCANWNMSASNTDVIWYYCFQKIYFYILLMIMSETQKTMLYIYIYMYFDRSGYGSKQTTLQDARENDQSIKKKCWPIL